MNRNGLFALLWLGVANVSLAICETGSPIDAVSEVEWDCMFPMTIGGLISMGGEEEQAPSSQKGPLCDCVSEGSGGAGIPYGFWEPKTYIDVVQDSWCFIGMGMDLDMESPYVNDGSRRLGDTHYTFAQTHYVMFPVLALLDMYYDLPCLNYDDGTEFDILMVSEILPTWNDDLLAAMVYPETVLFANPAAQLACLADAIPANANKPINELYWCLGSWGTAFPLTGTIAGSDQVELHAALAARTIFQMAKFGALKEYDDSGCYQEYVKMWTKNRYKLQMIKPTKVSECFAFGKSALTWATGVNVLENHSYFMFRKVDCCGD